MAIGVSWSRCPYCNKVLNVTFNPRRKFKKRLGKPEYNKCPNCSRDIWNGLKEWPDFDNSEKFIEIAKMIFSILFGGPIIGGFISLFIFGFILKNIDDNIKAFIIAGAFISIIIMILSASGFIKQIKESIYRYNENKNTILNKTTTTNNNIFIDT